MMHSLQDGAMIHLSWLLREWTIVRVSDFEEGLIWRLKWELFEKGDWRSASVLSSKVKCEDKNSSLTDLINTLKLTAEEK